LPRKTTPKTGEAASKRPAPVGVKKTASKKAASRKIASKKTALVGAKKERSASAHISAILAGMGGATGQTVEVTNPYLQNPAVFRGIQIIGQQLSQAPLRVYKAGVAQPNSPLQVLLDRPNNLQRQSQFVKTISAHQILHGNAYVFIDSPNSLGYPRALLPLYPSTMAPVFGDSGGYDLTGWRYSPEGSDKAKIIPRNRILHFPYGVNPASAILGVSPLRVVSMALDTDLAASIYNKNVLANAGVPSGVLRWTGDGPFDEVDAEIVRQQWLNTYGGAGTSPEGVAVLSSNFQYDSLGISARDIQWSEARKINLQEIARALNVPLMVLNEYENSGLSDAGLKVQWKLLHATNIGPNAIDIQEVLTEGLTSVSQFDIEVKFDFSAVDSLQDSFSEKIDNAQGYINLGYTRNEVNLKFDLGMENTPEGDVRLVPSGLIPEKAVIDAWNTEETPEEVTLPETPEEEDPEEESFGREEEHDPARVIAVLDRIGKGITTSQARVLLKNIGIEPEDVEILLLDYDVDPIVQAPGFSSSLPEEEDRGLHLHSVDFKSSKWDLEDAKRWCLDNQIRGGELKEEDGVLSSVVCSKEEFVSGSLRAFDIADGVSVLKGRLRSDYIGQDGEWQLPEWRAELSREMEEALYPLESKLFKAIRGFHHKLLNKIVKSLASSPGTRALEDQTLTDENLKEVDRIFASAVLSSAVSPIVIGGYESGYQLGTSIAVAAGYPNPKNAKRLPLLSDAFYRSRVPYWDIISESVKKSVMDSMVASYTAGSNLADSISRVKKAFSGTISTGRSRVIARTESGIAASLSQIEAFEDAGVSQIEWLSAGDARVRRTHQIDGEVVSIGETFSNGLRGPLDAGGKPEEIINCRCSTRPVRRS
jgi:HK97 family phage portal protein